MVSLRRGATSVSLVVNLFVLHGKTQRLNSVQSVQSVGGKGAGDAPPTPATL